MLADDEKARIRAEEIYRQEVRGEIEKQDARTHSWWDRLNSPFGIWLLSSIILTLITFSFGQVQNWRATEHERVLIVRKLDAEISRRIAELRYEIQQVVAFRYNPQDFHHLLSTLRKVRNPVFPEYRESSLSALLWELKTLVKARDRREIETVFKSIRELEESFERPVDLLRQDVELKVSKLVKALDEDFSIRDWPQ